MNVTHVPYQEAWDFQRSVVQERAKDLCTDTLLLVEHDPVFTMGRTTKDGHWKRNSDRIKSFEFSAYEVERGGSVTYHGPGQVVGYPIMRLRDFCPGPKVFVGMLQEVIIRVLTEWKIHGILRKQFPGVWIEGSEVPPQKIAAIGVRIVRGVTMHGLAVNVNVDLKPFGLITPCGIEDCQVTSMEKLLDRKVDIKEVRERLAYHFAEVFGIIWIERKTTL